MDIRRWFTSPKGGSNASSKPEDKVQAKQTASPKKSASTRKRSRVILDSDSEEESSLLKTKRSPKKQKKNEKKEPVENNSSQSKRKQGVRRKSPSSSEEGSPSKKRFTSVKEKRKKKANTISDDDDFTLELDSDSCDGNLLQIKDPIHKKIQVSSKKESEKAKPLKPTTVAAFFGSDAPLRKSSKKTVKDKVESIHDDDDFCKTLKQIDEKSKVTCPTKTVELNTENTTENVTKSKAEDESKKSPKKESKLDESKKTSHSKSVEANSKKTVENVNNKKEAVIKSPEAEKTSKKKSIEEPKKEITEETPPSKKKGSYLYRSYLEREGPKALGSKEIPEGEEGCLDGMTFIITGVLESIERDDAKALIEKYGGKVMTTLSKNTKYMVIGRDAGSSKLDKAEKLGTIQLDEDGLLNLIKTTPSKRPGVKAQKKKIERNVSSTIERKDSSTENQRVEESKHADHVKSNIKSDAISEGKKEITKEDDNLIKIPSENSTSEHMSKPSEASVLEMWVDKYKPVSLKQVIGQQGEKSNAKKLLSWLLNWHKQNFANKKPASAGRWYGQDDGSSFKAALLSGPPGVGKTTTAQLVCKEAGYDYFELNASDTRSKKSLQQVISQLLGNQTLADCFKVGNTTGVVTRKHAIIMDEVDGMAGNEDRGGVGELITFIKASKIPIICICNDRNHPKIRSLSNYCFDLRFQRPTVPQIKGAMMSIACKEGLTISSDVLQDVIVGSNQDIRQVLHNLSLWCKKEKGLSAAQAKQDVGKGTKNIKLGPFDVLREVFAIGNNPKATIHDKSALFFHDYSIAPLFVQENYVHVQPTAAGNNSLKHLQLLSETADSICIGDLIDKQIRSRSSWSLLPTQAIFASVIPGELMTGHLKQMISFPQWLGKNSNRNHMDRILQELQMHMRMRITGNKTDVALEYLPLLKQAITKPLIDNELEGVKDALRAMNYYCLLREDFDSIIELSLWPNKPDPRSKISAKVKSAFTRAYNKECVQNPYAVTNVKKKRGSAAISEDTVGEEGEEKQASEDEEEDDNLENDAMIKVKKPTKKAAVDSNAVGGSKKGTSSKAGSKKGRSKK